jgi:hypothetical protein
MAYRTKNCLVCGIEFAPSCGHQKYCEGCMAGAKRAHTRQWRVERRLADAQRKRVSYALQLDKERARAALYRSTHTQVAKEYKLAHPEIIKAINKKHEAKRRSLGFIVLNTPFSGCEGHHVDKDRVLYVPKELHRSIPHDVWTGRNMDRINARALEWVQTVEA